MSHQRFFQVIWQNFSTSPRQQNVNEIKLSEQPKLLLLELLKYKVNFSSLFRNRLQKLTTTGNLFKNVSLRAGKKTCLSRYQAMSLLVGLFCRSCWGSLEPWEEGGFQLLSFTNYHLGEDDTDKACHVTELPQATRQLSFRLVLKNMPLK